ncbi:MAG: c-type cytochrome [Myxococcales bacterium]|nr:c-type cytochrome [Myxococcales bacterium]
MDRRIGLLIAIGLALAGCWDKSSFNERPQIPDQAKGKAYRDLQARLNGEPAPASAAATAAPANTVPGPPPDEKLRFVEVTPEAIARGKESFAMCSGCHGLTAEGRVGIAPRLASASFLAAASDRMLFDTISRGREGTTMTPWGPALGDAKIREVIAYLRSLAPSEPAALDNHPLGGDAIAGQGTFQHICATCHGRSGAGYQESGSGTGIGRRAFLSTVTDGYLRYVIKHGKSQTAMRPFAEGAKTAVANLSSDEIENVIAYLRHKAW